MGIDTPGQDALTAILARLDRIEQSRIDELTSERQTIVDRRARGDVQDDDAPVLARLDADLEGVGHLLDSAETDRAQKARAAKFADESLAQAEKAWAREGVFNATCDAYQELADNLLAALEKLGKVMPADA
jgi:hypothetical protein